MYYPWFQDPNFNKIVENKLEISGNLTNKVLATYQHIVSNYINPASPYNSVLLYFSPGTGKTIASIAIAENFIRSEPSKKIIIITKNQTLVADFKSDLDKIYKGKPARNYGFFTYHNLRNGDLNFTDKIVIIDEVHNLLGNSGYDSVMKYISSSKGYKLVLLSATPAYDSISDMFQLSNMLNGKTGQYDIKKLQLDGYLKTTDIEKKYLYKNKILELTSVGKKSLLNRLHGKVSYLKSDTKDFPSVSYPGSKKIIDGLRLSLGVVSCKMSAHQNERYLRIINNVTDINVIEGSLEMLSSIIYPDVGGKAVYGKSGMDYFIKSRKNLDLLKEENVKKYSTKLHHLLINLKGVKGKVYISTKNIKDDGVPLIKACLRENGYSSIIEVTSELTPEEITNKINKFNRPENDRGEKYQILLGSGIISEGITLKCIRQVHVYEPSWNYSSIDQIIGRAVRRNSHSRLPQVERTVDVYLYCSLSSNIEKSVDFARYFLSSAKDRVLKEFERLVALDSFTCNMFKKQNTRIGIDGSRECDYDSCNYTCNNDNFGHPTDSSTFNIFYHDFDKYVSISSKIVKIFEKTKMISLTDLASQTKEKEKDVLNLMKTKSPVDVYYHSGIYVLKNATNKGKFKKIERDAPSNVEEIVFHLEIDKFLIEVRNGSKSTKKACLTGYPIDKLKEIYTKVGLQLPRGKSTKKMLCENLEKEFKARSR
jgi:superfamily II DNA or RNA helicase